MRTEDGHIVYRCLNGDTAAFGLLVDKYKASIYALAYSRLHNYHDAEDITQEAFLKAYQKLRTLKWWDNFLAWLYAIASNLCKQWVRSQSKRPDREFSEDQSANTVNAPAMDSYQADEVRESLEEALDSISESYRQVLTLYYLGGMNSIEIARFLGTSPNNIAQRLKRARAKLKDEMLSTFDETADQQKLGMEFTFRVVEMIKHIKIQPMPRTRWLPWGLSSVSGTILTILCFAALTISLNPANFNTSAPCGANAKLYPEEVPIILMNYENIELSDDMELSSGFLTGHGQDQRILAKRISSMTATRPLFQNVPEAIFISGQVLRDSNSVSGAQVHVYAGDDLRQEITTQVDGSFQAEVLKPDGEDWEQLLLTAKAPHLRNAFGWVRFYAKSRRNIAIRLHDPVTVTEMMLDEYEDNLRLMRPEASTGEYFDISGNNVLPVIIWTRGYMDGSNSYILRNLPDIDCNIYSIDPAQVSNNWFFRAKEYIEITESRMSNIMDIGLEGGLLARRLPDLEENDSILPDYIISAYRPLHHRSQMVAIQSFQHVDFQFQKDTTLIVTLRGDISASGGSQIAIPVEDSDKVGKSTIIGLEPGQKFSVKADNGDLQLSDFVAPDMQPDAEVEILMKRHETARVAGHMVSNQNRPVRPANVGLVIYLHVTPGAR